TSTVVSPLIVRLRVRSKPWARPGHLWCSVRVVVVRNVLSSSRPCPLSTLRASRSGGSSGAWPSGGKGGSHRPRCRSEAEAGAAISLQSGLVGLGEEEVVSPLLDDGGADVALAEHG